MQIAKSIQYIKAADVTEQGIKFKIIEEPKDVEGNYGIKLECKIQALGPKGDKIIARWTINNRSRDTLIDKLGSETADWIGKEIPVSSELVNGKESIIAHP